MRKSMIWILVTLALIALALTPCWAGKITYRQEKQWLRIEQGIISGSLTAAEARILYREQHHIQHTKKRAWSDGKLTCAEKNHLEHLQQSASCHIFILKHNSRSND